MNLIYNDNIYLYVVKYTMIHDATLDVCTQASSSWISNCVLWCWLRCLIALHCRVDKRIDCPCGCFAYVARQRTQGELIAKTNRTSISSKRTWLLHSTITCHYQLWSKWISIPRRHRQGTGGAILSSSSIKPESIHQLKTSLLVKNHWVILTNTQGSPQDLWQ